MTKRVNAKADTNGYCWESNPDPLIKVTGCDASTIMQISVTLLLLDKFNIETAADILFRCNFVCCIR